MAGAVDLSAQLAKVDKQIELTQQRIRGFELKIAEPGYEEKAPENVRKMNAEKVCVCWWLIVALLFS